MRVWLGEQANESDLAMDFLNKIYSIDFADPAFELQPQVWIALKHLRARPWWSRMWVVQETLLAKRVRFYCGLQFADREHFARLHEIATSYQQVAKLEKRLEIMSLSIASPFFSILDDWEYHRKIIAEDRQSVSNLIRVLHDCHCKDPRDRIFALLGMCKELDRQVIKIDYGVSLRWLMLIFCKYELLEQEFFMPLRLLQSTSTKKDPMLPSWVPDYTDAEDSDRLVMIIGGQTLYKAGADNTAWTSLGLPPLRPFMIQHFNSIKVTVEDEGSFETFVLTGLAFDTIQAAFRTPWIDIYKGFNGEEDRRIKVLRRTIVLQAYKDWEKYIESLPAMQDPYRGGCGRQGAFWRTLIANCVTPQTGPPSDELNFERRFNAWMDKDAPRMYDDSFTAPFYKATIVRCLRRSFFVTNEGYFGLGSCYPRQGDIVCIIRGSPVPFVLRPRVDEFFELVGEAYVHGIMDGEFVRPANIERLRLFKIR